MASTRARPAGARLSVSEESLDFGQLQPGALVTLGLLVRNVGDEPLEGEPPGLGVGPGQDPLLDVGLLASHLFELEGEIACLHEAPLND